MIDKINIADDVWNDKWDMENVRLVQEASKIFEFKDGKLVAKKKFGAGGTEFEVGDIIKPTDFPSSLYFIGLFIAMKLANAEKPTKITVNIKNAKALFDKMKISPVDSDGHSHFNLNSNRSLYKKVSANGSGSISIPYILMYSEVSFVFASKSST
jgi:hypothetical protein